MVAKLTFLRPNLILIAYPQLLSSPSFSYFTEKLWKPYENVSDMIFLFFLYPPPVKIRQNLHAGLQVIVTCISLLYAELGTSCTGSALLPFNNKFAHKKNAAL